MKWQDIAKISGGGSLGIFVVIAMLLNLAGMNTAIPPDITCDVCYSPVQVNSSVWEIKVEYAGDKPILFKKVSSSRTLWLNLDKVDEFVITEPFVAVEILVPTNKKYATEKHDEYGYLRPIRNGDSLIQRKNRYNPDGDIFFIKGETNGQVIKWGLDIDNGWTDGIVFDPFWFPLSTSLESKSVSSRVESGFTFSFANGVNMSIDLLDARGRKLDNYNITLKNSSPAERVLRNLTREGVAVRDNGFHKIPVNRSLSFDDLDEDSVVFGFDFPRSYNYLNWSFGGSENIVVDGNKVRLYYDTVRGYAFMRNISNEVYVDIDMDYLLSKSVNQRNNASVNVVRTRSGDVYVETWNVIDFDPEIVVSYASDPGGDHFNTSWDSSNFWVRLESDALRIFKFDLNSTDKGDFDSSGYSTDATIDAYTTTSEDCGLDPNCAWSTGQSGNSLRFDGEDDYVSVPQNDQLNFTSDFSICSWIKMGDQQVTTRIINSYVTGSFVTGLYSTVPGDIQVISSVANNTHVCTKTISTDVDANWNHFCMVFDNSGDVLHTYMNGSYMGNVSCTLDPIVDAWDFGKIQGVLSQYTVGSLDDVQMYNCTLNSTGVSDLNTTAGSTALCSDGSDGLVGHWGLNESSGDVAVDSTGNNNGTLDSYDRPFWNSTAYFGGGVFFDGVDDYVDVGLDELNESKTLSVSLWVKFHVFESGDKLVGGSDGNTGLDFTLLGTDEMQFTVGNTTTEVSASTSAENFVLNTWYHLVGVYNGTHVLLYKDGALSDANTPSLTGIYENSASGYAIAVENGLSGGFTSATVDEVMFFNTSLSADRIEDMFNGSKAKHGYNPTYLETGIYNGEILDFNTSVKLINITFQGQFSNSTIIDRDVSNPNLTAWYTLDNTTTDLTGAYDGTNSATPAYPVGFGINGSYFFNGVNSNIATPNFISAGQDELSVSAWFKTFEQDRLQIIWWAAESQLYINSNNELFFRIRNSTLSFGTVDSNTAISESVWYHALGVYNSTHISLYINNELKGTPAALNGPVLSAAGSIGKDETTEFIFNGLIDEMKFYNHTLTENKRTELYRKAKGTKATIEIQSSVDNSTWSSWYTHSVPTLNKGIIIANDSIPQGRYYNYTLKYISADPEFTAQITNVSMFYTNLIANTGTIWFTPKSNTTNSIWMLEFGKSGNNTTKYNDTTCGSITTSATVNVSSRKIGSYALNTISERGHQGSTEKQRFSLKKFPRRFLSNVYRILFSIHENMTADTTYQVDLNVTAIVNRTDSTLYPDNETYRLYRISRNGGVYNDTGMCYEQEVLVG